MARMKPGHHYDSAPLDTKNVLWKGRVWGIGGYEATADEIRAETTATLASRYLFLRRTFEQGPEEFDKLVMVAMEREKLTLQERQLDLVPGSRVLE